MTVPPALLVAVGLALWIPAGPLGAQATGSLSGRVTNAATDGPVAGAVIEVVDTPASTVADGAGGFRLSGVPVGIHRLRVRAIGYNPATLTNVVVGSGKPAVVGVRLSPAPVVLAPLEITPGYYPPITTPAADPRLLEGEEIRRAPGVQEDVIRAVSVLPGVGVTAPGRNDLVVRGGAPYENLFVVDGVEIPNLNHFGSQGSSGGPLTLINVDFVEETAFSAGTFGVRHGDRTAGLTDIRLRPGSDLGLSSEINLSATGAGFTVEGPLGDRTTFWSGVRRSYLDLLFRAAGFSFVPKYWDGQMRLATRPTDRDALSAFWIGALDGVTLYSDDADARYDNSRILVPEQRQYVGGLTWRRSLDAGAITTTLGRSFVWFRTAQRDSLDPPRQTFANQSREGETSLRMDWVAQAGDRVELNVGAVARWASTLDYRITLDGAYRRDAAGTPRPLVVDTSLTAWRAATYGEVTAMLSDQISLTVGARLDRYDFVRRSMWLSPRAQVRASVWRDAAVTASVGRSVQPPQYIWLLGDSGNPDRLTPIIADQAGLAFEARPREDLRLRLEGYYKWYRRYAARLFRPQAVLAPAGFEDVTSDIPFGLEPLASVGRGRSWGLELLAQKKPAAGPFFGLATATLAWSRFTGVDGLERPGAFDVRLIGTVLAGYRAGKWELSGKFRGSTGSPTTPFIPSGPEVGRRDFSRYNEGTRLPAFHAVDVRVDRRWSFSGVQLEMYLDVQNIYGRANVTQVRWDPRRGAAVADESLGILPTIGLNVEF